MAQKSWNSRSAYSRKWPRYTLLLPTKEPIDCFGCLGIRWLVHSDQSLRSHNQTQCLGEVVVSDACTEVAKEAESDAELLRRGLDDRSRFQRNRVAKAS